MSWQRFLIQSQRDLKLWLLLVTAESLTRLGILLGFSGHWDATTGLGDVLAACGRGLRFDMQLATVWCAGSLLLSIVGTWRDLGIWHHRVRWWLLTAFLILGTPLTAIDIGYFVEYHNQFDHFLFGTIYDDQAAILKTVWEHYHPLRYLGGALVIGVALHWLGVRWIRHPWRDRPLVTAPGPARVIARASFCLLLALAVVAAARGSLARRPLQIKDAAVAADRTLAAWVPTPLHALGNAISSWRELQNEALGLNSHVPDGDLLKATAEAFPELGARPHLDDYLARTAPGTATPARHVVLLVMESFDAWPLLEKWRPLHLTDQVAALGREGILVTDFLPSGTGTMLSLGALLTGLPDAGVYTAYRPNARQPFASSPAAIFKRLGYRTRFFYAGYLSWQRIGDFCRDQGFDEVYGGGHIGNPSGNEWGVDDQALFDFASKTLNDDTPSFTVILSTSNHPPYSVDVDAKGFPLTTIPAWTGFDPAGGFDRRILGHLWYSDRCAGDFIRTVERTLPRTVVALTGDHWSRRSMTANPTPYEQSCVPLLLHGPEVLTGVPRPDHPAGSHLDITPTLVDLCAPAGFTYHALGESVLHPRRGLGLGSGRVIGPGFLVEWTSGEPVVSLTGGDGPRPIPDVRAIQHWYQACYGLGWWRLMRSPEWPARTP